MTEAEGRRDAAIRGLEHEIGTLLRRIRRGLGERALDVHPDLNASSYLLLSTLGDHGPCRAADLAEMFALDKGSVSRLVHQLVELGLVERAPDPDDGRASLLSVTGEAVRRLAQVHGRGRETFHDRLRDWQVDELEDLAVRLGRFNVSLSDPAPVVRA